MKSQIATEVFVVDLEGANRYVMTTTADLAPLLDLPEARLERAGDRIRNVGDVAAIGVVWGDVIDLLPGEERTVEGEFEWGWNVPRAPA